ncbi:hypothetical protein A3F37_04165 [Candidatus Saccharibacteria bacterium RIFCSPHIGHO2_12_FULL_41_12]|nr:MAG: hypothetical protein A3F37_04165 [Candidatus Saccharibacteria bacterium RIFCSPHIGHO2_12_FULL_41_12]
MDIINGVNIVNIGILLVALLLSMSIHEAMHGFVAFWLGDDTAEKEGRLTLNPFAHIDLYITILLPLFLIILGMPPILAAKPVPFNPNRLRYGDFGAALVGVSGPITNLLLAAACAPILHVVAPGTIIYSFITVMITLNVLLFVFNMLPIPPLDGSRLLYAFSPEPVRRILESIESIGIMFIIVILLLLMPIIAPFISGVSTEIINFLV